MADVFEKIENEETVKMYYRNCIGYCKGILGDRCRVYQDEERPDIIRVETLIDVASEVHYTFPLVVKQAPVTVAALAANLGFVGRALFQAVLDEPINLNDFAVLESDERLKDLTVDDLDDLADIVTLRLIKYFKEKVNPNVISDIDNYNNEYASLVDAAYQKQHLNKSASRIKK